MIYMHTSIWYIYVCIHIIDMYIYIYTYIHSSYVDRKIKRIQQCLVMRYTIEIWNNRAWTLKVRPVSHVRVKIRNSLACVRSTFSCHVLCLFLLLYVSKIQTDLLAYVAWPPPAFAFDWSLSIPLFLFNILQLGCILDFTMFCVRAILHLWISLFRVFLPCTSTYAQLVMNASTIFQNGQAHFLISRMMLDRRFQFDRFVVPRLWPRKYASLHREDITTATCVRRFQISDKLDSKK